MSESEEYSREIESKIELAYKAASMAREKGYDPEPKSD